MWKNENELLTLIKEELYTPVVGDILDTLGYYHQFLPAQIQGIEAKMKIVGFAMPVLMIDVFGPPEKPFGLLTEALDDLKENEIYIATGGTQRCAYWGEMLTCASRMRGAVGAVVNGYHRDTPQVLEQNWPVFSWGSWAQDSSVRTQVVDFRCKIEISNIVIHPGDLIFGDVDGVLIIPKDRITEVIHLSLEKARGEKNVRKAIEQGMSATEAFATFGIL
ncbi:demethylmenaquinone methyltransferase [Enterococcus alcedinis]|uniref:Putative 4-hydroxy-4-methyl-2-oxoglutarate aldolase n=2 Tax=Enterococcus alcedinis TaxID=1274384 RepID=A0A917N5W1_9ENTE|nr:RraA family protein [Enterococcus alcedinis]MBP2102998.1 regulator of RNase E activity RraA [Enterococcus alcedinis]GGI66529.1 demethylmenaquinone methyltransferase [Enterococcus alcedinis]